MREMRREPEVPEASVPVVECRPVRLMTVDESCSQCCGQNEGQKWRKIKRFVNALQSNQDRNHNEPQDATEYMKGKRNGFLDTMERKQNLSSGEKFSRVFSRKW